MRRGCLLLALAAIALPMSGALANDDLMKLEKEPGQWAIPTGDYANTRFSKLDQINAQNAQDLHPVWSFSTGVLRGHEGITLVVGGVIYFSTPFANNVLALDHNNSGRKLG